MAPATHERMRALADGSGLSEALVDRLFADDSLFADTTSLPAGEVLPMPATLLGGAA